MSSSRRSSRRKDLDGHHRASAWRKRYRAQLSFQNLETRWLMATFSVSNTSDSGAGSLRQAIVDANANAGADTVAFAIGAVGSSQKISPTSTLPTITDAVTLDGWSQGGAGYTGVPLIELNGTLAGAGVNGLTVTSGGTTIQGFTIDQFSNRGISLQTGGGNLVAGNYIGTDPTGTLGRGNASFGIFLSSANNTIGGLTVAARNVVSGNASRGVELSGASATGNLIAGNSIGTDLSGTVAIVNTGDGIRSTGSGNTIGGLTDDGTAAHGPAPGTAPGNVIIGGIRLASTGDLVAGNLIGLDRTGTVALSPGLGTGVIVQGVSNTVGGLSPNARNIISGNGDGVFVGGAGVANNQVLNNYIGTDSSGTLPRGNTGYGVYISSAGSNNVIGAPGAGNVVAASGGRGFFISHAPGLIVQGNKVGTNAAGTAALPNFEYGFTMQFADGLQFGGTAPGAGNLVSGNTVGGGLIIYTNGGTIQGNLFGTNVDGSAAIPNGSWGLAINQYTSHMTVGGTTPAARNILSGNGAYGLTIGGFGAEDNVVLGNYLGLKADGSAALANGSYGINFGTSARDNTIGGTIAGAGNVISGNASEGVYIDGRGRPGFITAYYKADGNTNNLANGNVPAATIHGGITYGPGKTGQAWQFHNAAGERVSVDTDPLSFLALPQGTVQAWINLNSLPTAGTSYVVMAKASGAGTENYGLYVNSAGELVFEWYKAATAYRVTSLGANLTTGTYHHVAATADGTTVKLYADGVLVGQGAMPAGLDATASGPLEIGGLANDPNTRFDGLIDEVAIAQTDVFRADDIQRIFLNGGQGTDLGGNGAQGNVFLGNLIGLDPTGTVARANGANGVKIEDASNNTVGGATPAARNVISGQSAANRVGVLITGSHSTANAVLGNYIGTDAAGTAAIPNSLGVQILAGATNNTIGGLSATPGTGAGNVISGNTRYGIELSGTSTTVNLVAGNLIGTDSTGTLDRGNTLAGIFVSLSANNTIGGTTATARNVISGNDGDGILINSATSGNLIAGNFIGTDLSGTAAIPNTRYGVLTSGGGNTVGGLTDDGTAGHGPAPGTAPGNVIVAGPGTGVRLAGTGDIAAGNLVGLDKTGTVPLSTNQSGGVAVTGPSNTVGGLSPNARNVISGSGNGIDVQGAAAANNRLLNNFIGTDITGAIGLGNWTYGVAIVSVGANNVLGAPGAGNVVAASGYRGLIVLGAPGLVVQGNKVGTNAAGTAALPNLESAAGGYGIFMQIVDGLQFGGTAAGAGNLVSGNTTGVEIAYTNGGAIQGNFFGTNFDGSAAIPNGNLGLAISQFASNLTIGGTTPAARNVISGNGGFGVAFSGFGADDNVFLGNYVGLKADGSAALPNGTYGVSITSTARNNTIGGMAAGAGNVISGNTTEGVSIDGRGRPYFTTLYYKADGNTNNIGDGHVGAATIQGGVTYGPGQTGQAWQFHNTPGERVSAAIDPNNYNSLVQGTVQAWINLNSLPAAGTNYVVLAKAFGTNTENYGLYVNPAGELVFEWYRAATPYRVTSVGANLTTGTYHHVAATADGTTVKLYADGVLVGQGAMPAGLDSTAAGVLEIGGLANDPNLRFDGRIDEVAINQYPLPADDIQRTYLNGGQGTDLGGNGTQGTVLLGNLIGLNPAGTAAMANGANGVKIEDAANNTVGGTTPAARNVISGQSGANRAGVFITGSHSIGNVVASNFIGTDSTGAVARGNATGVLISNQATGNTIGGPSASVRNIISGNQGTGVEVDAPGNTVQGNWIGVDVTGIAPLGNAASGIVVQAGNETIGGPSSAPGQAPGNVIAANGARGLYIYNAGAAGSTVQGNLIGLGADGSTALGNALYGIYVALSSQNVTIGGSVAADRNVISANGQFGIITDPGATGLIVQGNFIGTDATGTLARGNTNSGLQINSPGAVIGGPTTVPGSAPGNVIAANGLGPSTGVGILQLGGSATIRGNIIGLNASGTARPNNDQGSGIVIQYAPSNVIGGSGPGDGNLISGNAFANVEILGATTFSNAVAGNRIGTDITGQALPVGGASGLGVRVVGGAHDNTIGGTTAGARNVISGNSSYGIVLGADGDGFTTRNMVLGNYIGTDVAGLLPLGNVGGIAVGGGGNTIGGGALGAGNVIWDSSSAVGITGSGAIGNQVLGNIIGLNATGSAALGTTRSGYGLYVYFASSTVIGAPGAGNVISGMDFGILNVGSTGTIIQGNRIGTNSAGTADLGNKRWGISTELSTNTQIGGTIPGTGNLISGNDFGGVVLSPGATGGRVEGNSIGTNATGMTALPNGLGVWIGGAGNNTIGGTVAGAGNLISGNTRFGIEISNPGASGNQVLGNFIGTDATGSAALGNSRHGVQLDGGASNNSIGGPAAGQGNTIAFNQGAGVAVLGDTSVNNPIRGNAIYRNTGLGIDLGGDGVTRNDLGDLDGSPNHYQNFPLVTTITPSTGLTRIGGSLNSQPNQNYIIDFYASPAADVHASAHGGARTYLGSTTVTTFLEGNISFLFDYAGAIPLRNAITATATDAQGNTSEFALNFINNRPPVAHITATAPLIQPDGTVAPPTATFDDIVVLEGSTVDFDAADPANPSTDPDGDALSYTWYFDDGTTIAGATSARTYLVAGQYSVLLLADDHFGGMSTDNVIITVKDALPTIPATLLLSASTIVEGQSITLSGSFVDPNPIHSATVTIDWGDGSPPSALPLAAGIRNFASSPHTYLDNPTGGSTFPITVTVTASDNQSATRSIPVTVTNVSPTLTGITRSAATINENDDLTVGGTIVDPGVLDAHTVVITWGDGLAPAASTLILPAGQFAFTATRRYLDDPGAGAPSGTYPIAIAVTDKDAGTGSASTNVTVANVPPTVRLRGSFDESSGLLTMQSFVTDTGTRDTFTYAWQVTGGGVPVPPGHGATFSFAPTSNTGYLVTLTVTDNSGGTGSTSAVVFIGTPNPDLITIAPAGAGQVTITSNGTAFGPFNASIVVVFGKERDDTIRGDPALTIPLELHGGSGNDTLIGAQGDDAIFGGPDSDSMVGGPGDDTLMGEHGNDTYIGGLGNDTYIVIPGSDSVLDESGDPVGIDTIDLSQANSGLVLDLAQDSGQVQLVDGANTIALSGTFEKVLGTPYNDILFGNAANNELRSGGGNDYLFAGGGNDTLFGGTGNSTLVGSLGGDTTVFGGSGDESILGGTGIDWLDGGAGNDTIFGGIRNDTLGGGKGNSTLFGGAGNDLIAAGNGNTTIFGGDGDDTIFGGIRNDTLGGGAGNSTLFGGIGDELIDGGAGNDTIFGGVRNDTLGGGKGNTTIFGGDGDDLIVTGDGTVSAYGGAGNDTIFGGVRNDTLGGGKGNSTIFGGMGDQILDGGAGNDTIFGGVRNDTLGGGKGNTTIFGGDGDDLIVTGDGTVSAYGGAGNDTIFGGVRNDTLGGGLGNSTIFGGQGDQVLDGGAGNDTIFGGVRNDTIGGGKGNTTIFGGDGNDLIEGGFGRTTIDGGDGDDTIFGGIRNDSIGGGRGNSTLFGGVLDESIVGGPGNDTIFGGVLNDTIGGGRGNTTIFGGDGDDLIVTGDGTVSAYGGAGNDTIFGGIRDDTLGGGLGNTTVFGSQNDQLLDGGDGDDTIFGGIRNDTLGGGKGNTTIFGGAGNDLIEGGFGRTTIDGGDGDDTIFGGVRNDSIGGGRGNTTLFGGVLDESIVGGPGNDTIFGGVLNDTIGGGRGNTTILGGDGNDLIVAGDGRVTVSGEAGDDTIFGGVWNDTIGGGNRNTTIFGGLNDELLDGGAGNDTIFGGVRNDTLGGGKGNTTIFGGDGDDLIAAGDGPTTVFGGAGNDVISTGSGDDSIDAGAGDDTIFGGIRNDTISGGKGNTTLFGGDGNDLIVAGSDHDLILTGSTLIRAGEGNMTFSGIERAWLLGGPSSQLIDASASALPVYLVGGAGDDTLRGGGGDDTLEGGPGNDLLVGGAGDDTYRFGPGILGSDTIQEAENAGADLLDFSTFGGPVAIDLNQVGLQLISPGLLTLSLSGPTAIEDVYGSAFNDVLTGNARDNRLYGGGGADAIDGGPGNDYIHGSRTQVVYLDFDSWTTRISPSLVPSQHVYSPQERDAIQERIGADYALFAFTFTQVKPASGPYATLVFNIPQGDYSGGAADEIDWRDLDPDGAAIIDVNHFLGGPAQPAATSANFIALSATIAAHELGHLSGLEHGDAFGPIGAGVFGRIKNDPNRQFLPAYPGPFAATETPYHLMASPDSIRTDLFVAAADPFFGEREAVKLAFADHGAVASEQAADHQSLATAQPLVLTNLYVPNPLLSGLNAGRDFSVRAAAVVGSIRLGPNGLSEDDYYAFQGRGGEYTQIEILSAALARFDRPIDSLLTVYDSQGHLVNYYGKSAENDDAFQNQDARLIDLLLPADGTYYIKVDTFFGRVSDTVTLPDTETGSYELFVYGFAGAQVGAGIQAVPTTATVPLSTTDPDMTASFPADDLYGGISGDDTVVGGAGPTIFRKKPADQGGFNAFERVVDQVPMVSAGPDQAVNVGATVQLPGSFTDPDDTGGYTFAWTVLNSTGQLVAGGTTQAFSFVPATSDLYFATFRVTDGQGGMGQATARITVGQVTPTIAISGAATAAEGSTYTLNLATAGIAPEAITGWTIVWGDGTTTQVAGHPGQVLHTYADGPSSATITATALVGTATFPASGAQHVAINNVAPTATLSSSGPVLEGTTATVSFAHAYDPSPVDLAAGFRYSLALTQAALANSYGAAGTGAASSFSFPDNGAYTVYGRIFDKDGGSTDYSTTILVANVAPTAALTIDPPPAGGVFREGDTITARFTNATDPSPADLAAGLRFSFARNPADLAASYATAGTLASTSIVLADDGVQVVYGRVFDKDGGFTNLIVSIPVAGVAPVATLSNTGPTTEGSPVTIRFSTPVDPSSADVAAGFRYSFALAPSALAATYATAGAQPTVTFLPYDNGTYTIYGRVFDKDNLFTETTTTVVVGNVAPTATMASTGPILEGGQVLVGLLGGFDPSLADTVAGFHYSFAVDPAALATTYAQASTSYWTGFTFGDNGSNTVYGRIFDKDGGSTDYATTVTVKNVPPTARLSNGGPVTEGSPVSISFSAQYDPSPADVAAGFHYSFATTQAALAASYAAAGTSASTSFTFPDNGSSTVYGRIFDKDGGSTDYATTVTVQNVPPTATFSNNGPVRVGSPVTVGFSNPFDPSSADVAAGFHYSFATSQAGLAAHYTQAGTSATASFTFPGGGTYPVYGRIFDKDDGFADYTTTVTVQAAQVATSTTLTTSAAGNTISFGLPITLTTTVSADPSSGVPTGSVAFVDTTTGNSLGSVVLAGAAASLTTAILPVGSQTITATYSGDANHLPSSATRTVTVLTSIIVLDPSSSGAVSLSLNAIINIPGALVVDSRSATALTASGNARVTAGSIQIVGGFTKTANVILSPTPTTGISPVADGFSTLAPPTGGIPRGSVNLTSGSLTINPGIYSQISVASNASLSMNPGVYIITGGGFSVSGNASVSGAGILVYNTGSSYPSPGGNLGGIAISSNGTINLKAATTGAYAGILFFQSRDNTRALSLGGNATVGLTGAIYAPSASLSISGNAQVRGPLIVSRLNLSGNGSSTLMANGSTGGSDVMAPGELMGGNLWMYVDDPEGRFTLDQRSRILAAIAQVNELLVPYSVTITQVDASQLDLANLILDTRPTSAVGGLTEGVLGCMTFGTATTVITLIQGWSWYAGVDSRGIGADQFDFETVVIHELGHALGLGHRTDPSSVMYASLTAGSAKRSLAVADLAIRDLDGETASGLHAVRSRRVAVGALAHVLRGLDSAGLAVLDEALFQEFGPAAAMPREGLDDGPGARLVHPGQRRIRRSPMWAQPSLGRSAPDR